MTNQEYREWYIGFLITAIGPAVKREANNNPALAENPELLKEFENKKNGIMLLSLVSFIESNFLDTPQLRDLRNFNPNNSIPQLIDQNDLSCFIYIRDCFAHNPNGYLFDNGINTSNFETAINTLAFIFAELNDRRIIIKPHAIHHLHLMVLEFFNSSTMVPPQG